VDVLSDMLSTVRLESSVFAQTRLPSPWGIRADARDHFAFHIISRGRARLEVDGLDPVDIEAGDVVVLGPGQGHSLRDRPESATRPLEEMLADGSFGGSAATGSRVEHSASGSTTGLICGCFRFADLRGNRLLDALPAIIHIRETDDVGPWLAQTIRLLMHESTGGRPGTTTVVDRLCDALFIYIIRSHLAALSTSEPNWLRALVDPEIGAALRLLHAEPGSTWSIATLAARVGMSRSAFAARFTRFVGETPRQYLIGLRMQAAARMLRAREADLDRVAEAVGYESVAAFSKAFKRAIGVPPGAYRRTGGPGSGFPYPTG
jgi:AraC-like DNA-binding protein